jgi:hypothetical protein
MVREERQQYGNAIIYDRQVKGIKKTQPPRVGDRIPALAPSPSKSSSSQTTKQVSWLAASTYSLRLPKSIVSVAIADFVPLTVAGQRWSCTIFPDRKLMLRYNLVFDPY